MPRFTHKQILYEFRTVMYPIVGADIKKMRSLAKKLQSDTDTTSVQVGSMVERVCNMLEKPGMSQEIL